MPITLNDDHRPRRKVDLHIQTAGNDIAGISLFWPRATSLEDIQSPTTPFAIDPSIVSLDLKQSRALNRQLSLRCSGRLITKVTDIKGNANAGTKANPFVISLEDGLKICFTRKEIPKNFEEPEVEDEIIIRCYVSQDDEHQVIVMRGCQVVNKFWIKSGNLKGIEDNLEI